MGGEERREGEQTINFTTPRTFEMLIKGFGWSGGIEASSNPQLMREVIRELEFFHIIDDADFFQFLHYLENRGRLIEYLEGGEGKLKPADRIAVAALLGNEVRAYVTRGGNYPDTTVKIDRLSYYLKTLCKSNETGELLKFFVQGLGAFSNKNKFSDSIKLSVFAYEIMNGKNPKEAMEKANQASIEISLVGVLRDMIEEKDNTREFLRVFSEPKDEIVSHFRSVIEEILSTKIDTLINLIKEYCDATFDVDDIEKARVTKEMERILDKDDYADVKRLIEEILKEKLKNA